MTIKKFLSDNRGAVIIETAFALPVLVLLMIGMLQFSLVLQASGAMRHAIGQGIRFAKVNPSATETEVLAEARQALGGINPSGIKSMELLRGTSNGADFANITMTYEITPIIPFAAIPPISLTEVRQGYLPS